MKYSLGCKQPPTGAAGASPPQAAAKGEATKSARTQGGALGFLTGVGWTRQVLAGNTSHLHSFFGQVQSEA